MRNCVVLDFYEFGNPYEEGLTLYVVPDDPSPASVVASLPKEGRSLSEFCSGHGISPVSVR